MLASIMSHLVIATKSPAEAYDTVISFEGISSRTKANWNFDPITALYKKSEESQKLLQFILRGLRVWTECHDDPHPIAVDSFHFKPQNPTFVMGLEKESGVNQSRLDSSSRQHENFTANQPVTL